MACTCRRSFRTGSNRPVTPRRSRSPSRSTRGSVRARIRCTVSTSVYGDCTSLLGPRVSGPRSIGPRRPCCGPGPGCVEPMPMPHADVASRSPMLPQIVDLGSHPSPELTDRWRTLALELDGTSYFQTPDWILGWWRTIAERPPTSLALWSDDEGKLQALVGLSRVRLRVDRRFPLSIPVIVNAGSGPGDADHCGPLVDPALGSNVAGWLLDAAADATLLLRDVDAASEVLRLPHRTSRRDDEMPAFAHRRRTVADRTVGQLPATARSLRATARSHGNRVRVDRAHRRRRCDHRRALRAARATARHDGRDQHARCAPPLAVARAAGDCDAGARTRRGGRADRAAHRRRDRRVPLEGDVQCVSVGMGSVLCGEQSRKRPPPSSDPNGIPEWRADVRLLAGRRALQVPVRRGGHLRPLVSPRPRPLGSCTRARTRSARPRTGIQAVESELREQITKSLRLGEQIEPAHDPRASAFDTSTREFTIVEQSLDRVSQRTRVIRFDEHPGVGGRRAPVFPRALSPRPAPPRPSLP